jgi:hypothetical protein
MKRTMATAIDFVHSQTTRANDGDAGARRGEAYFVDAGFAELFAKNILLVSGGRRPGAGILEGTPEGRRCSGQGPEQPYGCVSICAFWSLPE